MNLNGIILIIIVVLSAFMLGYSARAVFIHSRTVARKRKNLPTTASKNGLDATEELVSAVVTFALSLLLFGVSVFGVLASFKVV